MNDDHDMTRHLPNAEAMPADFEQTEALPTLVGGVSEQASAVTQALPVEPTQALPVEPTQALPVEPTQTLPVAETEAMPVEKVAVPQTETKSLPVDSASTEKLSAEPLAAGAVSGESAAPVTYGQTETEPAADAFGVPPPLPIGEPAMFLRSDLWPCSLQGAASCRSAIHRRGRHATA